MDQFNSYMDTPNPDMFSRANAGDDSLFVVFYMGTVQNQGRTVEEGRPIFDDVECVRIIIPGDKNSMIDRPADANDKRRFAKQYGLFKQGASEDAQLSGTRLDQWPFLTRGQIQEFAYLGIKTVEQLATVRDDVLSRVPGMRDLQVNAKAWLAKTQDSAAAAKQAKAMAEANARVDHLENVVKEQAARIEAMLKVKA